MRTSRRPTRTSTCFDFVCRNASSDHDRPRVVGRLEKPGDQQRRHVRDVAGSTLEIEQRRHLPFPGPCIRSTGFRATGGGMRASIRARAVAGIRPGHSCRRCAAGRSWSTTARWPGCGERARTATAGLVGSRGSAGHEHPHERTRRAAAPDAVAARGSRVPRRCQGPAGAGPQRRVRRVRRSPPDAARTTIVHSGLDKGGRTAPAIATARTRRTRGRSRPGPAPSSSLDSGRRAARSGGAPPRRPTASHRDSRNDGPGSPRTR